MDLDLDNLTAVRVLGKGATGTVFLVADRSPERSPTAPPFFALKVVDKSSPMSSSSSSSPTKKPDAERRARWEVSLLARLCHPFLPSLLGRLETAEFLAWAAPYCPGGDLNALRYSQTDRVFSPSAIRFYVSEIVLALAHLHSLGVAYRDLKPENVLIQASGHVTLTDFDLSRFLHRRDSSSSDADVPPLQQAEKAGDHRRRLTRMFSALPAAKEGRQLTKKKAKSARVTPASRRCTGGAAAVERSHSFVGTEEYVAPEVVRCDGHEFAVDWWALGILAYEMAYGRTPFRGRNRKETFHNVVNRQPEFVGRQPPELVDLIGRLLAKDPSRRLGFQGGAEEVKAHPFFRGVQWELLPEMTRPPFLAPCLEEEEEEEYAAAASGFIGGGFDLRDYLKNQQRRRQQQQQGRGRRMESARRSRLGASMSFTEF